MSVFRSSFRGYCTNFLKEKTAAAPQEFYTDFFDKPEYLGDRRRELRKKFGLSKTDPRAHPSVRIPGLEKIHTASSDWR